jgi:raffinose/stachyose/melibiose transport system substrate-binding protein
MRARKRHTFIAGIAAAAALLTALAAGATAGGSGPARQSVAAKTTLTFWFWGEFDAPGADKWLAQAVKSYQAKHPDIAIKVVPQATDTFIATFTAAATAKRGPDIAAQWATGPVLAQVWSGAVTAISDLVPKSEQTHWLNTSENTYGGKLWAMPVYLIGIPWAYNKTLFARAGVKGPLRTWNDFIGACTKLRAKGITPFGFGDGAYWTTQLMLQDLNSLQDQVDAVVGKRKFTDSKYARFEDAWKQAVDAKCFNDDVASLKIDKGQALFATGKAAMSMGTDGQVRGWAKQLGAAKVGVMPWPVYGKGKLRNAYNATQSTSYFVTSWTKYKKESAAFLMSLHSPANLASWYRLTGVPPADDRFSTAKIKNPLDKQLYKLNTTGPQVWLQNFFPPQVDLAGNVPAQQLILGGRGSGASAATARERAAARWRATKKNELKNWQAFRPATPR